MLHRSTDHRCRYGAHVVNLVHSASFHSRENNAPSKPGTKHLDWDNALTCHKYPIQILRPFHFPRSENGSGPAFSIDREIRHAIKSE